MAITRNNIYDAAAAPNGTNFLDQYAAFMAALMDTSVMRLTTVAGTDTITATAEPISLPTTGLATGMKFTFTPANNNTGAVTLNIDGAGAKSVVAANGGALSADDLDNSTRYILEYDGTNFVILSSVSTSAGGGSIKTTYDSTGVWDNTFAATALVRVQLWAGGGGGSTSGGGGGGGYNEAWFIAGDLASSVTVTVGAGGSAGGTTGGDGTVSSFGSLLFAYGGAGGGTSNSGGGGGGEVTAGSGITGGSVGGGDSQQPGVGLDANSIYGGGGGSGGGSDGGNAVFGGGGGGSTGGTSASGGDGGGTGAAGTLPAGGGGYNAGAGAGGRCIITVIRS